MILYYVFYFFFIYSCLGWAWESCYESVRAKKLINRGFLNGPLCPIYGIGMILLIFFLHPVTSRITENSALSFCVLFFTGMVVCTLLEYITSVVLEKTFHATWWDYHSYKFNIQGRICLIASLFWGVMSAVLLTFVHPFIKQVVDSIPIKTGEVILTVLCIVFALDAIATIATLVDLKVKLVKMEKAAKQLREHLNAMEFKKAEEREALSQRADQLRHKYAKSCRTNFFHRRLFSAYPHLNPHTDTLMDLREYRKGQQ